ncbi:MAG: HEAT repeat domain-containing protein, partial [Actinomycetota bacterium]
MSLLGSLFRVRPGEGRSVGLLVALMFTSVAGLTIGESGISALFFDRVGADALPQMYLAQGAVGLVAMLVLTGSLGRAERGRAYVVLPLAVGVVALIERAVVATGARWIYPALWLTVAVAMLVQAVFTWGIAGLMTDTRRAKRLFPLFSAGGILGAVVGGLVTRPLATTIGAENLLIVWAATLAGAAALCGAAVGPRPRSRRRIARSRHRRRSARRELLEGFAFVRRSPLLLWMTAAAVLFSVLFYSLYLPFAQASAERFPDPDDLAGFFGVFWAVVTGAAFLVSVLLTNRLVGWLGATSVIVVLPILYTGSFGVLLATSTLTTLAASRFAVSVWMQGVASPAWETMVNVVPDARRDQTRAFLNGGPTQAGTAIAGVTQLVGQQALSAEQLALVGLGAAAITILVTWQIRRTYVGALVDALRAGRPSVFAADAIAGAPIVLEADGQALALALEAARDPDPRVRRLAVEMLSDARDTQGVNVMVEALGDPDALVRANALRGLRRRDGTEHVALLERALRDEDATVRLAAVTALRTPREGMISKALGTVVDDADPPRPP